MLKKDFPLKFNEDEIPTPTGWNESYGLVENVNVTEAGTDQVSITRYDKLSVSASFQCSSKWAQKFKAYSVLDQLTVTLYDLGTAAYKTRIMRIRSFQASQVENSELTTGTNGLWKISFTLEEF